MDIDYKKYPQARIFEAHGVEFTASRGEEFVGTCPFTDKPDKFYVNRKTWLWDSKTAGLSGNIAGFLKERQAEYEQDLGTPEIEALAKHRKLPPTAFRLWYMGWTGTHYTIPVKGIDGKIVDIRQYEMGSKQMRSTAGVHVGLLGAEQLNTNLSDPVFICEGEWDAMALRWLLRQLKAAGIVVAVPGAGIFKQEWAQWFVGRRVFVLYDHDEPGRKGEQTVHKRLATVAKSLSFTHWPEDLPNGFDVRDWIMYGIRKKTLDKCWERLQFLFKKMPRNVGAGNERKKEGKVIRLVRPHGTPEATKARKTKAEVSLQTVYDTYRKWLYLPSTDAIDVMLATAMSQEMDGPPVWMFLVSPPGGAKTITLAGLSDYEKTYSTSSLTAHSLISGANFQGQADPSLIPRLHGKVLVIKDFTSILGLRDNEKEEIFSILRDAFDGKCGKTFGNGVERTYESRFTILAAVTPSIYDIGARHSALGERFLKYVMGDNLQHANEVDIISKAIDNVDQDSLIREELTEATSAFLSQAVQKVEPARLDSVLHHRIISLAQLGARLRGTVSRDTFNSEMMTGRPFAEVGSRLGIQLAKLARALATVRGKKEVSEDEYTLVKKVMIDTVSQRSEDIVRIMHLNGKDKPLTTADIAHLTRYPITTVRRVMDDLNLLKVVTRKGVPGSGFKHSWTLSKYVRDCIEKSHVYADGASPRLLLRRPRKGGRAGAGGGAPAGGAGPGGRKGP